MIEERKQIDHKKQFNVVKKTKNIHYAERRSWKKAVPVLYLHFFIKFKCNNCYNLFMKFNIVNEFNKFNESNDFNIFNKFNYLICYREES